jgi:hypothetical protein
MSRKNRLLTIITITTLALLSIPTIVSAAGGAFVDDDMSIFEGDIEWLATANVTLGCNPPANDQFCPTSNVTRGQMAAFMRRFAQFLGAEDGVVSSADQAAYAADADRLDGHDSTYFTGNDGYSVYHDADIDIPTNVTTLLTLPDLPAGSYLFIAKAWFYNGGASSQYAEYYLVAGADSDYTVATVANAGDGIPATWTVVHTFTNPVNAAELQCRDYGNDVILVNTKITGIRLDSLTNQAG